MPDLTGKRVLIKQEGHPCFGQVIKLGKKHCGVWMIAEAFETHVPNSDLMETAIELGMTTFFVAETDKFEVLD